MYRSKVQGITLAVKGQGQKKPWDKDRDSTLLMHVQVKGAGCDVNCQDGARWNHGTRTGTAHTECMHIQHTGVAQGDPHPNTQFPQEPNDTGYKERQVPSPCLTRVREEPIVLRLINSLCPHNSVLWGMYVCKVPPTHIHTPVHAHTHRHTHTYQHNC